MTVHAIGDVQGCATTLERLLQRIGFDPGTDRLLLCGDLVNRGPRSLDVLRWARSMGESVVTVLGNHDVHLLAVAEGLTRERSGDTLREVLEAPDRTQLLDWLRTRPFVHREDGLLLVHAGLLPSWSPDDAVGLAREAEAALQRDPVGFLAALHRERRAQWRDDLAGLPRLATAVNAFTRLRTCTVDGQACDDFAGPPADAPQGCVPWFDVPGRRSRSTRVVCGHWAALGLLVRPDVVALDTGCVWGRALTALRLSDDAVVQEPAAG